MLWKPAMINKFKKFPMEHGSEGAVLGLDSNVFDVVATGPSQRHG